MQIQAKIGGILYDRGRKPGSNYPDLEQPGKEFWNRVRVLGSDYKSLVVTSAKAKLCDRSLRFVCHSVCVQVKLGVMSGSTNRNS